jgi:ribonuclease Z
MLSTFGLLGRTSKINIYGDAALEKILNYQLKWFCRDLGYEVAFHAVDTTRQYVVYEDRSLTVETIPLDHRLPCCGYLFREKQGLPHIRREMIDFYAIPVSQILNIKNGQDYVLDDGTVIPNAQLVKPADPPRAYAYVSDTKYLPSLAAKLKEVTTLYHEATYGDDNLAMAEKYNHSTARQAALLAREAGVGQLILGHYSSRYTDENVLLDQAKEEFPCTRLAQELDTIDL